MALNPKDPRLDEPLSSFTLTDAVNVAKAMVHPDYASFVTPVTIKPTHEHPVRSSYPIRICKNYFEKAAKAEKRKQSMSTWDGYFLGGRDILTAKNNFDLARVNGQRTLIYRLDTGQLAEATVWGSGPGDEGSKVPLPFWHVLSMKVEENQFKRKSGETDIGYTMSYLDKAEPLSSETIISQIAKIALPVSALDRDSHIYAPVIITGKLGSFKPIEEWEETGQLVPVLDADRNPVVDPKTGNVQMRPERMPSAEGQPLIQPRIDNPEKAIYTFAASIAPIDEDDKSDNRLKIKFLNKRLGNHFVNLPIIDQIFADAIKMGASSSSEDAIGHLTNTYAGTEVLAAGVITRFSRDEEREINWIDMEATLLVPLGFSSGTGTVEQVVTTSAPVAAPQPAPSAEIVAPPAAPVAPVPAPAPAAIPKATHGTAIIVDTLKSIVLEGRELYGPTLTLKELESLRILPSHMVDADGKLLSDHIKLVNHVIGIVAKEYGDSPVGASGSTGPPIADTPAVEKIPNAAAPQMEPIVCNKCGKNLQPSEVLTHSQVCTGKPE